MIELVIDNRENIKDFIAENIKNTKFENLELGDYKYRINGTDFLIIERKTIADYAASIKDGRNREQKKRLLDNFDRKRIIYLVEGDITKDNSNYKYNHVNKDTIISSIINTLIRDDIHVFHTINADETCFLLGSIYNKLEKQGDSFIENKSSYNEDIVNTVKIKKNSNITPNIAFQMMLNCIPNVSSKISQRISSKYNNLNEFIKKISEFENRKDAENYIINMKTDDTDKGRKISKNTSSNIINFMGLFV